MDVSLLTSLPFYGLDVTVDMLTTWSDVKFNADNTHISFGSCARSEMGKGEITGIWPYCHSFGLRPYLSSPPFVLYHLYRSIVTKNLSNLSSIPPTPLSPPTTIIPSLRSIPSTLLLWPGKESLPKAATTTRAVSLITLTPVTFFLSFAAVRNSIAVDSIASLTTAYS
ncbi:unnamed protein product [Dovyalis caffra]|uniref:Uncharacterized protein n=1 Tax=Dovyalis caffra TaxID=77055 RepID=A0AAV1QNY6_9ROSI|nr:unnamed protein product [Dovyalis caffra]